MIFVFSKDVNLNSMAVSAANKYYIFAKDPNGAGGILNRTFPDAVCATMVWRTTSSEDFAEIDAAKTQSLPIMVAQKGYYP